MLFSAFHCLRSSLIASGLIFVWATIGNSQARPVTTTNAPSIGNIIGKVVLPDGSFLSQSVRIRLETARGVSASIFTDSDGRFVFGDLSSGNYQIVIDSDRERFETTTQKVEVVRGMPVLLTIVLKEKKTDATSPAVTATSPGELDRNIPAQARKEFDRGTKASHDGNAEEAIEHFRDAIAIYPLYLMARNDLGAQLLAKEKFDEAEVELRAARDIDKAAFNPTLNLGIVLVKKHEFREASDLLTRAVAIRPGAAAARFYLGLALFGISSFEEAAQELKKAHDIGGNQYALALFHLGELYMDRGERSLARQYFEQYLSEVPQANNAEQVLQLIAMLK
jgi:tetratricopeptide (TPR) repeat protein